MRAEQSTFPHRLNENGTYDSICLVCFQTIATGANEAGLAEGEQRHVCDLNRMFNVDVWSTTEPLL